MKNITILIIIASFISCNNKAQETTQKETTAESENATKELTLSASQLALMNINLVPIAETNIETKVISPGKVVVLSQYQASITAKVSGTIESVNVLEGQKISKNQVLMTISSPEFVQLQESYINAKSEVTYLKADFERQQALYKEKVVGEKEFQLIRAKYESALSRMRSAKARLKILKVNLSELSVEKAIDPNYKVQSPIAGYLYKLPVSIGLGVTTNTEVSHVVNMEKLHADIFVYEKDINKIYEGQKVDIEFANQTLSLCKGTVEFISRGIDPIKRSVIVHIVFDPPKGLVLPDMTVKATFLTNQKNQLVVPTSSILQEENEWFVFVAETNGDKVKLTKEPVLIGTTSGSISTILPKKPFKPNTKVAETGILLINGELKKGSMQE